MNAGECSYSDYIADTRRACAVAVHRGLWRDAPENSLLAIERAIGTGAEVVEIDIRRSADGGLFLLHDETLDRMAGINRAPEELSLQELTSIKLRNRNGGAEHGKTAECVPGLKDVFDLTRDRIFLHLDVKDRSIIPEVVACARDMGVLGQVDFWGDLRTPADLHWVRHGIDPEKVLFMAKTRLLDPAAETQLDLLFQLSPRLCEVIFNDISQVSALARRGAAHGMTLWCNTLDDVSCAGFTDTAALKDPEGVWGQLIDAGVSVIQTDQAEELKFFIANREEIMHSDSLKTPMIAASTRPKLDMDKLLAAVTAAAEAEVLPRFGRLSQHHIRTKTGATDLVTEGDEAAERHLRHALSDLLPEAMFLGEESVAADPTLLDRLADAELAIVVDPIDGTANYAAGMPLFNVVLAVTQKGKAVAGIIYDPISKSCAVAETGGGAYLIGSDGSRKKMRVADPVPLRDMYGYVSIGDLPPHYRPGVLCRLTKAHLFASYRCASHEYRAVADGHAHFAMYHILNPWDHLAGTLLVREAGGYAARTDNHPYDVSNRNGALVTACDFDSWEALSRDVFSGMAG